MEAGGFMLGGTDGQTVQNIRRNFKRTIAQHDDFI